MVRCGHRRFFTVDIIFAVLSRGLCERMVAILSKPIYHRTFLKVILRLSLFAARKIWSVARFFEWNNEKEKKDLLFLFASLKDVKKWLPILYFNFVLHSFPFVRHPL
jgi:hypothetical protein